MLKALWKHEWTVWSAAKKARADKMEELLAVEAYPETAVNQKESEKGLTPLMVVMSARNTASVLACVHILLSFGADVTIVDSTECKNTALHCAARNNKAAVIGELQGAGADIFVRNNCGLTALDVAWSYGRHEAALALIERMQVHCGWLEISEKVAVPRWRRCWCVVLGRDSEHSSMELCVFRDREQVRPDEVLHVRIGATSVVPPWSMFEFHIDDVKVEPIRQRLKKSTETSLPEVYECREFAFACDGWDVSNDRYTWMRALQVCSAFPRETHHSTVNRRHSFGHLDDVVAPPTTQRSLLLSQSTEQLNATLPSSPHRQEQDRDCIVCMEAPRDAICAPCGHTAVCRSCLFAIRQQREQKQRNNCPVCRTPIEDILPMIVA